MSHKYGSLGEMLEALQDNSKYEKIHEEHDAYNHSRTNKNAPTSERLRLKRKIKSEEMSQSLVSRLQAQLHEEDYITPQQPSHPEVGNVQEIVQEIANRRQGPPPPSFPAPVYTPMKNTTHQTTLPNPFQTTASVGTRASYFDFAQTHSDGNAQILTELSILGTAHGSNLSDGFRAVDRNADGKLGFDEFLLALERLKNKIGPFTHEKARLAFSLWDQDNDGFVDFRDFVKAFLGKPTYTIENIKSMFYFVNPTRRDVINKEQYLHGMQELGFLRHFSEQELLLAFTDIVGKMNGISCSVFQNLVYFFEAETNWRRIKFKHHDGEQPFLTDETPSIVLNNKFSFNHHKNNINHHFNNNNQLFNNNFNNNNPDTFQNTTFNFTSAEPLRQHQQKNHLLTNPVPPPPPPSSSRHNYTYSQPMQQPQQQYSTNHFRSSSSRNQNYQSSRTQYKTYSVPRFADPSSQRFGNNFGNSSHSYVEKYRRKTRSLPTSRSIADHLSGRGSAYRSTSRHRSPKRIVKKYRVMQKSGCPVTKLLSPASPLITILPAGTTVHVAEKEGNRCRITYPINGWCNLHSTEIFSKNSKLREQMKATSDRLERVEKSIASARSFRPSKMPTLKDLKKMFKRRIKKEDNQDWTLIFFQFDHKDELSELLGQDDYQSLLFELYEESMKYFEKQKHLKSCYYSIFKVSTNSFSLIVNNHDNVESVALSRGFVDYIEEINILNRLMVGSKIFNEIDYATDGRLTISAGIASYQQEKDLKTWQHKAYFAGKLARQNGCSMIGEWHIWWDEQLQNSGMKLPKSLFG